MRNVYTEVALETSYDQAVKRREEMWKIASCLRDGDSLTKWKDGNKQEEVGAERERGNEDARPTSPRLEIKGPAGQLNI